MPRSVLHAIQDGQWDYEPSDVPANDYQNTEAMPGSQEKLALMAERLSDGLPLWHPDDRQTFDDEDTALE